MSVFLSQISDYVSAISSHYITLGISVIITTFVRWTTKNSSRLPLIAQSFAQKIYSWKNEITWSVFFLVIIFANFSAYNSVNDKLKAAEKKNDDIFNIKSELKTLKDVQDNKIENIRDPDAIYQLNSKVGSVSAANPILNQGIFTFGSILADGNFNKSNEFEYREYILKIDRFDIQSKSTFAGRVQSQFLNVTCLLIRKK